MTEEDKRMYDKHQEHGEDMSYENEGSTVRSKYITDRDMIGCIDKIEELVRALRKHIVRTDIQ